MGLFDWFGGGKKDDSGGDPEAPAKYEPPPYVPSDYDKDASKSIYDFYSPRMRGENTGYSEEDLNIMKGQAQDYSTRQMKEAIRRGAAARRPGTGGTWSGGRDTMRDEAIRGGLEFRSNAMRDIAVRNAVLKHQDEWNATQGMGTFLNNERAHALAKWTGGSQQAAQAYQFNELYPQILDQQSNQYNRQADYEGMSQIANLAMNLFNRYQTNAGQ